MSETQAEPVLPPPHRSLEERDSTAEGRSMSEGQLPDDMMEQIEAVANAAAASAGAGHFDLDEGTPFADLTYSQQQSMLKFPLINAMIAVLPYDEELSQGILIGMQYAVLYGADTSKRVIEELDRLDEAAGIKEAFAGQLKTVMDEVTGRFEHVMDRYDRGELMNCTCGGPDCPQKDKPKPEGLKSE